MFELIIDGQVFTKKTILENIKFPDVEWKKEILFNAAQFLNQPEFFEFQTSGSTGTPKTITFSISQIIASSEITKYNFEVPKNSNVLLCLPQKYVAGKMMLFRALVNEWKIIAVEPRIELDLQGIGPIDFAAMVPMQVENLLQTGPGIFDKIKKLIIGGARIDSSILNKIQSISSQCFETFGMTETLTHIASRKLNGKDKSNYFKGFDSIDLRQHEDKSLIIDAHHLNVMDLNTNDMVEFHDFNEFEIIGRKDRIINSGGIKINPEVVEKKLEKYIDRPYYIDKKTDSKLGEKVVLVLEGEQLHEISMGLLNKIMQENLSKFEMPKEIIFKKEFARSSSGKIKHSE